MTIKYSKRFRKHFRKLREKEQERFWKRLEVLKLNPQAKQLNRHSLSGRYAGLHSINVGGDLRALYIERNGAIIIFELIGTHSQLYGK